MFKNKEICYHLKLPTILLFHFDLYTYLYKLILWWKENASYSQPNFTICDRCIRETCSGLLHTSIDWICCTIEVIFAYCKYVQQCVKVTKTYRRHAIASAHRPFQALWPCIFQLILWIILKETNFSAVFSMKNQMVCLISPNVSWPSYLKPFY